MGGVHIITTFSKIKKTDFSEFRRRRGKTQIREYGTQGTHATGEQDQRVRSEQTGQDPDYSVADQRRQGASWPHAVGPVHLRRLWLGHFRDCDEDQCVCAELSYLTSV